jgi:multidrug efflux pump
MFENLVGRYDTGLTWVLDHQKITLIVAVTTFAFTALLYLLIPKGLFPVQDTGQLQVHTRASQTVSYDRMSDLQQRLADALLADTADVESISSFVGVDASNNAMLHTGQMLINLRPHHGNQEAVMERLRQKAANVAGIDLFMQPTQDLTVDAETGPTQYRISIDGANTQAVNAFADKLAKALVDSKKA